jgi:phage tail protein X
MTSKYTSREGDMVDAIVWGQYGRTDGQIVEQVMDANPVLADHGPELPAGVVITLPDVQQSSSQKALRLWD